MKTILCIGDIYGKTGREAIKKFLPVLKEKYSPTWIIANGENISAGNGLSLKHLKFLREEGIDIITSGNHIFSRLDWHEVLKEKDVLRPHNLGTPNTEGCGCKIFSKEGTEDIAVINLAGRVFMEPCLCPFETFDKLYETIPHNIPLVVDFHGEATSEKLAFFRYVKNRATIVYGTHTHVQTSDEMIFSEGKTACITDLGMTGAKDGIIGVDADTVVSRFVTGYSEKFLCAIGKAKLEGIAVKINENGMPLSIERIRLSE